MPSIYLSPSTQENNVGAGTYGTEEKVMNRLTDALETELKRLGITVHRNKPEMSVEQIVFDSNAIKPDFHFAIHTNACDTKQRGCEVYCHRFGGNGERFARLVYDAISSITPTEDRGVKQGFNFYGTGKHMYELAYTDSSAALIEIAFHDNMNDVIWILSKIPQIATELAKAICKYFEIPYISIPNPHNAEWLQENGYTQQMHKRSEPMTVGMFEDMMKNKYPG